MPAYSSLVLGVSPARFHDYGHWNAISYNGPDSLNLPVMDPGQLFNMLFSVPQDLSKLTRRASLLDAVREDANDLRVRGALNTGVHVRDPDGNFSKAHVTMLRALGLDTPSFGFNGGQTKEEIPGMRG